MSAQHITLFCKHGDCAPLVSKQNTYQKASSQSNQLLYSEGYTANIYSEPLIQLIHGVLYVDQPLSYHLVSVPFLPAHWNECHEDRVRHARQRFVAHTKTESDLDTFLTTLKAASGSGRTCFRPARKPKRFEGVIMDVYPPCKG